MAEAALRVKPKLRGVFHELAFFAAVGIGIPLVLTATPGKARLSAIVFASCVAACFGASALYHRPTWQPRARSWFARLDHAGIYLLIAGTYTPFCLLVLSRGWAVPELTIIWTGLPKRASAAIGLALGWVAVVAFTQLLKLPTVGLLLLLGGGLAYTLGAVTYARRRPDPFPRVLGYHEVFHGLTIVAAGCQYAAIAFYVLPRA